MAISEPLASWLLLTGRVFLAAVFLVSGFHKGIGYQKAKDEFTAAGVPAIALFLPATILLHLIAPICLIFGIFTVEAALALAAFTVIATVKVHAFWRVDGDERLARSRIAMAHLAVVGGLLLLAATGPGRIAL